MVRAVENFKGEAECRVQVIGGCNFVSLHKALKQMLTSECHSDGSFLGCNLNMKV